MKVSDLILNVNTGGELRGTRDATGNRANEECVGVFKAALQRSLIETKVSSEIILHFKYVSHWSFKPCV